VQATYPLADADALGKMSLPGSEESNEVDTTWADIVDGERLRTSRATDIDDFT
jgi:hypothetical protein